MYIQSGSYHELSIGLCLIIIGSAGAVLLLLRHIASCELARSFSARWLAAKNSLRFNIRFLEGRSVQILDELHAEHGNAFPMGSKIFTRSLGGFQSIYSTSGKHGGVYPKSEWYTRMSRLPDLFTDRDISRHARARKMIAPAFNLRSVNDRESSIAAYTRALIAEIQKSNGKSLELGQLIHCFVTDLMFDILVAKKTHCMTNRKPVAWTASLARVFYWATVKDQLAGTGIITVVQHLLHGFIDRSARGPKLDAAQTIQEQLCHSKARDAIMLQVLDKSDHSVWSADTLFPHVRAVLLASIHSTTTALTATLKFILQHPQVHKKLMDELENVFASEQDVHLEKLSDLKYMNAVIDESLRLFPPIPLLGPRMSPGLEIDGIYVERGQEMLTSLYSLHRNPLYFPDPNRFWPERWLGENTTKQKAAFQPFSTGSRSCIGKTLAQQVLRYSIAQVLLSVTFESIDQEPDWSSRNECYTVWEVPKLWVRSSSDDHGNQLGVPSASKI